MIHSENQIQNVTQLNFKKFGVLHPPTHSKKNLQNGDEGGSFIDLILERPLSYLFFEQRFWWHTEHQAVLYFLRGSHVEITDHLIAKALLTSKLFLILFIERIRSYFDFMKVYVVRI